MQAQVKRRIVLGITTGGLFAGGGLGFAHADASSASAGGDGGTSNSPGILSGNSIQIPVDIPINVCGVTANVLGLLNPAAGNQCSNSGGSSTGTHAGGGATAKGGASDSPGILSGNNVQVPVHAPVNVCGDTVNVVGLQNGAVGNRCSNGGTATGTTGTHASGGASAHGGASNSPGILSGNNVQVPIDVPVNACGDTVNVIGLKNPATGNHCANDSGSSTGSTGSSAHGGTSGSPGILSGNDVQAPIDVPVNVCGDSVNVLGLLDKAAGNACANGAPQTPVTPPSPPTFSTPPNPPPTSTSPGSVGNETIPAAGTGSLAHTGSNALMLAPVAAGMAGGGMVLYRKFKPGGAH